MAKMLVQYCMGCGKIKYPHDTEWEYPRKTNYESFDDVQLSHGYCEPCAEKAIAEFKSLIAEIEGGAE